MIIDELNKKISDIENLANDKTGSLESKVNDLTDGILMVADAVDTIPELVDEKLAVVTKEITDVKNTVSKVKAMKGEKGDKGDKGEQGDKGVDGLDGKDGSPDTPEQIAEKLNELEGVLDTKVLKDFEMPNIKDLERQINTIGNQTLRLLSKPTTTTTSSTFTGVTTDATLTGLGTQASPLSVVATSASDVAITVRAATTANLAGSPVYDNGTAGVGATLTRGTNGILPNQDGRTLIVGDRLLVKNQSTTLQNGIYEVTSVGSDSSKWVLTRTTDADETSELDELVVTVSEGSTNRGTVWGQQTNNPVVGTNAITFATTVSTSVTQATSGTQVINQIPLYTGTARQLTRGTSNFKYNPTNDLFTIRGIDYLFPANNGDASQVLTTDGSGNLSWTSSVGAAGSNTYVQFNDGGVLGADSGFTFNKSNGSFKVGSSDQYIYLNNSSNDFIVRSEADEPKFQVRWTGADKLFFNLDRGNGVYQIGDIEGVDNNTKISIDDVNETIAFDANGNTAYSSDIPLSIKVTVPSADLLAVVTGPTPYQLIPAPGAGKFIDVISIVCNLNFNTTAYDFNNALRIGTNTTGSTTIGTDGGQLTISPYNMINASATKLSVVGSANAEKNVNTALYLNAGSATTVTTGDSDIDLYITYKIVTL